MKWKEADELVLGRVKLCQWWCGTGRHDSMEEQRDRDLQAAAERWPPPVGTC